MSCTIRDARLEDASALTRLTREELGYDYPEDRLRAHLEAFFPDSRQKILVAEQGGEVLGYLQLMDYDSLYGEPMKTVMGIAVSSSHRGEGIGRALLEAGEEWARATGAAGIRLTSGESRSGAHDFYRHCGYEEVKRQLYFRKMF